MTTHTTPADPIREALAAVVAVLRDEYKLGAVHSVQLALAVIAAERALAQEPQAAGGERDWLHLKSYGYAPGNYMSRCYSCAKILPGLDKRAIRCRPCAEKLYANDRPLATPPAQQPAASAGQEPVMYDSSDEHDAVLRIFANAGFKYDGQSLWSATLYGSELLALAKTLAAPQPAASQDAQAEPSDAECRCRPMFAAEVCADCPEKKR